MKDGLEEFMIGAKTTGNGRTLDIKYNITTLKKFHILIMN